MGIRLCSTEVLKLPDLFDDQGKILKLSRDLDHFSTFGIERSFAVDPARLTKTYKALQRQLHPDLFSLKSKEEQDLSAQWSSLVNDGYKVTQISCLLISLELEGATKTTASSFIPPQPCWFSP